MNILGRIKLPSSADVSSLYVHCNEGATINYPEADKKIMLHQGGIISLNSYFNSVYENFYAKYTKLDSIYYLLKLEGDFEVSLYREVYEGNNRELIAKEKFEQCHLSDDVKVLVPNLRSTEAIGRIYLSIICLSDQGVFKEGVIATDQAKTSEVSLGIISCTFKKEAYIRNTVHTILQDKLLQTKEFKIFIVDNGRSLSESDFSSPKVQLISNKNVGGSGGFTRGLIEALESNAYSHFLFMDDDIELDSESIYRLFTLYEYAKSDFAVAGSMLDLSKKHFLYEAGSLRDKNNTYRTAPLKHNLELETSNSLNFLLLEENLDYGGFWFFAFSKKLIEEIGLPMPFFIKVDDIEFGLRIKESVNSKIVAFPAIAVWHEPFYAKYPIWDNYYTYRNCLINNAIHGSLGYNNVIKDTTNVLIVLLLFFEYNSAELTVKAFEDYLKGPDFLKTNAPEILHYNILKLSKSYNNQNIQQNYLPPNQVEPKSRAGSLKKIVSLLTLNGHLLPNFLTSDDEVFVSLGPSNPGQRVQAFAKKRVNIFREGSACLYQNDIDKMAGIRLLTRWFKLAARSSIKWSSISTEWKNASKELTSTSFWQQYLGLKE